MAYIRKLELSSMLFADPLYHGKFLKRYKRFFADIEMLSGPDSGKIITAHTPNTGSMLGCLKEGAVCQVTHNNSPTRKLKYTLETIAPDGMHPIGVNTSLTNKLVQEALQMKVIGELVNYDIIKPEYKISNETRLDFYLKSAMDSTLPECFLEVKNVTLKHATMPYALFPDAITSRGLKHLEELMELKKKGYRSVLLFIIQREDVEAFSCDNSIDTKYSFKLREARDNGVEVLAYQCTMGSSFIKVSKALEVLK